MVLYGCFTLKVRRCRAFAGTLGVALWHSGIHRHLFIRLVTLQVHLYITFDADGIYHLNTHPRWCK